MNDDGVGMKLEIVWLEETTRRKIHNKFPQYSHFIHPSLCAS